MMEGKMGEKDFERYNPQSDVVRCPYGRSGVRSQLDEYARAAVNLYGVISCRDFVGIFNEQNKDQTTEEELYTLLLPLVRKTGQYGFYKDYLVNPWFFDDFEEAEMLVAIQEGKPRYVPVKSTFLKFVNDDHMEWDDWQIVRDFLLDTFGMSVETMQGYWALRDYISYGQGTDELGAILDEYGFALLSEERMQEFVRLIILAKNNTRIWDNNGHTPDELFRFFSRQDQKTAKVPGEKHKKPGRNDPCPCGSGRKYKKCCGLYGDSPAARLSEDESRQFYELWLGLIRFVNDRRKVVPSFATPKHPDAIDQRLVHQVRVVLWDEPELITEYIREGGLSPEQVEILNLWKEKHKKGIYLVMQYQPEYAVFLGPDDQGEDRLYGVKGITNPVANVLQRGLPDYVEAVLLPFKGKVVYDTLLGTHPLQFGEGAKASFQEMYDRALRSGIVTSLE